MEVEFPKVKIVARIRQSNISETYSSGPDKIVSANGSASSQTQLNRTINDDGLTTSNPTASKARSVLTNAIQQTMAANSSLDKDGKVCIFTASSSKEKPVYVAASGNPIKKQLLTDYVKTDKNIIQFRHSILENANIFKFDHAMSYRVDNSALYNDQCKELVQRALSQGVSSTFIVTGPAKAGKKFTIKGGEQKDKGILTRTVDDLIELTKLQSESTGTKSTKANKSVTIRFGIFAVFNNEVVNLLPNDSSSSEDELVQFDLTFSGEYRKQYMKSRERLKSMGGDQSTRRMHIFYKFAIFRNATVSRGMKGQTKTQLNTPIGGLISTITIIHCADFCKPKMPEFVVLGDYLSDIATRKDSNLMEIPAYSNSSLIQAISDSLNSAKDNHCVLICNISGAFDYLSQSVNCLQYCAGIKERVDHFFEDVNEFNSEGDQQNMINALATPSSETFIRNGGNNLRLGLGGQGSQFTGNGFADSVFQSRQQQNNQGEGVLHIPHRDTTFEFHRQRGPKPNASEIQLDLSNLVKDIYTFTDQTNGLIDEEITAWALDREAELRSILTDIQNLPAEEQKQFDTAALKIQESLQFLASIRKNSSSLSQNKNNNSGQDMRSSNDFGSLMSQNNNNNRSREMMRNSGASNFGGIGGGGAQDELFKSQTSSLQQGDYTYDNQDLNGKKTAKKLREQILQKIDEIVAQNENNKRTVRPSQQGNRRSGQQSTDSMDHTYDKQNRDLQQLKDQLIDYNYAVKEKKQLLKKSNEELKAQVDESRTMLAEVERIAEEKKGEVQYLQDNQVKLKEQVERDREIIQIKIENEEALERQDEELRNLIQRMNVKLSRRKEECSMLKQNIDRIEEDLRQEREQMEVERDSMDQQLRLWEKQRQNEQEQVAEIEANKDALEAELDRQHRIVNQLEDSLKDENQKVKQLVLLKDDLQYQLSSAQENAEVLLEKLASTKAKGSQEMALLLQEKEEDIVRKKEQIARFKAELKQADARVNEMAQEVRVTRVDNQNLLSETDGIHATNKANLSRVADLEDQVQSLNAELKRLRNVSVEATQSTTSEALERKRIENENARMYEKLQKTEANMRQLQKEVEEKTVQLESIKRDIRLYDQENTGQKEFISKLERQNQFLSENQGDSSKIDNLQKELQLLRRENKELRLREEDYQNSLQDTRRSLVKQTQQSYAQSRNVVRDDDKTRDHSNSSRNKEIQISQNYQMPNRQVSQQIVCSSELIVVCIQTQLPTSDISSRKTALPSPHRSILKKPRFNLTDDSLDSLDSDA